MLLREMSREECDDLLGRLGYGHLACAHDNQPYVVPIYFVSDRGHLYGFSTKGQKIEWMRLNPRVCVEADEVLSHSQWASVVVQGHYEEYPDTPEYAAQSPVQLEASAHLPFGTAHTVVSLATCPVLTVRG